MTRTKLELFAREPNPNLLPAPVEPEDVQLAADCIAFVRDFAMGPPIYDTEGLTPSEAMATTLVKDGERWALRRESLTALAARIEAASSEGSAT